MVLTPEQSEKIKEHLLKQLSNFPEDKRNQIQEQVESMTQEQVEEFVEKNNLEHLEEKCIFCSIIKGETPSVKISEKESSIAILEINPLSKGHTLVVPKEHSKEINKETKTHATEITNLLKEKFSPNEVKINETKIMNHPILEIIPIYGNEESRHSATETELKKISEELKKTEEKKEEKVEEKKSEEKSLPKLKPRIPN